MASIISRASRVVSPGLSLSDSLRSPTQLTYLPKTESLFCTLPSDHAMSIRTAASDDGKQYLVVTTMGDDVSLTPEAGKLKLPSQHSRFGEYSANRRTTMTPTGEIFTGRPNGLALMSGSHQGEEVSQYLSKYADILEPRGVNVHLGQDQNLKPTAHGVCASSVLVRELYELSGTDCDGTRRLVSELKKDAPTTFSKVNPRGEVLDNAFLWVDPDDSRIAFESAFSVNGAALSAAFESARQRAGEDLTASNEGETAAAVEEVLEDVGDP
ncbi:hypothetical protein I350_04818 [Cryptococcus amylolentus CBS 6273]|uniref:Uncharacterized protein n=1 Tax=Cryptococcus amylolentus CBS 6273 TaxID=1296118 RepID=A0A1E3JZV2_9TREE|nr:hypothetical protein I350_04818 [Cryptococcus amylolentus CBS 6273]